MSLHLPSARSARPRAPRRRPNVLVAVSALVVVLVAIAAVAAPWLVPDATRQDLLTGITPSGPGHPLGTDDLGRDVLQLLIAGARTSATGAALIALGSLALGLLAGIPAGYLGGWTDLVVMRVVDLIFSVPALLVALVVTGILGGGFWLAVLVLVVLFSPTDTRVVRGAFLEERPKPYVEAAQLAGLSGPRIAVRHVLPSVFPLVLANALLNFAFALVALSSLSYLGLGVDPGSPDWGRTLADNRGQLTDNAWAAAAPGLAIILTAAAVTVIGDWWYDRLDQRRSSR